MPDPGLGPRHPSVQASLDSSYQLLSASERMLFRRLSAFEGGWPIGAAEQGVNLARMLAVVAAVYRLRGDPVAARPVLEECLELARGAGDDETVSRALTGLGWAAMVQADYFTAKDLFGQALALAEGSDEGNDHALTLAFLGELAWASGERDEAREHFEKGFKVAQSAGAPLPSASCLENLGRLALAEGDLESAGGCFAEALSVAERAGLWSLRARCLVGLGELAQITGEPGLARHRLKHALSLARDVGDRRAMADALSGLAGLTQERDQKRAVALYVEALSLRHEVGDRAGVARSLETFAYHAASQGQPGVAARLFGAVHALREDMGMRETPGMGDDTTSPDQASVKAALGPDAFAVAWAEGAALTLDEAVAYASRGRGPRSSAITGWDSLTGTEREVAELVRQGLTNPEVAARLFISPRTVQGHLMKVFAKLHISSRRQLREQTRTADDRSPGGLGQG